jgi:hypothetical protein
MFSKVDLERGFRAIGSPIRSALSGTIRTDDLATQLVAMMGWDYQNDEVRGCRRLISAVGACYLVVTLRPGHQNDEVRGVGA